MNFTKGEKVRVVDRRDGATILRGEVAAVDAESVTVSGRYEESAFAGKSPYNEQTIRVSPVCVEREEA